MPRRGGWRNGQAGLAEISERLSADRLAELSGLRPPTTPEAETAEPPPHAREMDPDEEPALRALALDDPIDEPAPGDPWPEPELAAVTEEAAPTEEADLTEEAAAPEETDLTDEADLTDETALPPAEASEDPTSPVMPAETVSPPAVIPPAGPDLGRHRRPVQPKLSVWGVAFTTRSLEIMGLVALLIIVSVVLFAVS